MMYRLIICFLIITSCSSNEQIQSAEDEMDCDSTDLPIISDGKSCDIEANFLICEIIEVDKVQYISDDSDAWSPELCSYQIGDEIEFKNGSNSTFWDVVDRAHHISEERILLSCNENYEHATFVCQKNEVINVKLLSDLLGPDTMTLELRTAIYTYEGQTAGAKYDILKFRQQRGNTNVVNFSFRHFITDEDYYEHTSLSFNENLTLEGQEYNDVLKYERKENIWADPYEYYYMQKGKGILGFEIDGKLWLRE